MVGKMIVYIVGFYLMLKFCEEFSPLIYISVFEF